MIFFPEGRIGTWVLASRPALKSATLALKRHMAVVLGQHPEPWRRIKNLSHS
jgi:hypothetical protein